MSIVYFAVFGHSRLAVGVTSPLIFHLFLFLLFVKVYLDIYSFKSMLETWGWLFGLFFIPLTLGMDVLVAALLFLNVHNMIFIILSIQPIDLRIFWTGCCMFNVVSCCEIEALLMCTTVRFHQQPHLVYQLLKTYTLLFDKFSTGKILKYADV